MWISTNVDFHKCGLPQLLSSTKVNLHKCGITQISTSTEVNPQRSVIAELWSSTNVDFHKCEIPQSWSYANVNSANADSGHNRWWYVRRWEGFAELVLEIQGVELAHRYAKIFRAYKVVVAKRCPLLMEYGLTQESQLHLHQQLGTESQALLPSRWCTR